MENEKKENKVKSYLIWIGIVVFIGYFFYYEFVKTTNEIGFLGVSKEGRQIFIQTLDGYLESNIKVDSDFYDHSFLSRILVQEPMRTVIRFDIANPDSDLTLSSAENFLNQPYEEILGQYKGNVSIGENSDIAPQEIDKRLKEHNGKTMEDFLAGFGFKQFQIYQNGKHILTTEIKGVKNVYWSGK